MNFVFKSYLNLAIKNKIFLLSFTFLKKFSTGQITGIQMFDQQNSQSKTSLSYFFKTKTFTSCKTVFNTSFLLNAKALK